MCNNLCGKIGEFTIFNKLTQMKQPALFCIRNISYKNYNRVHNSFFIIKAPFFSENVAKEIHPEKATTCELHLQSQYILPKMMQHVNVEIFLFQYEKRII